MARTVNRQGWQLPSETILSASYFNRIARRACGFAVDRSAPSSRVAAYGPRGALIGAGFGVTVSPSRPDPSCAILAPNNSFKPMPLRGTA